MTDRTNAIAIEVTKCQTEEDFSRLRARYIREWGTDAEDYRLRIVLEDAIERRRGALRRMHGG